MLPYQQRVIEEKRELDAKREKLREFIDSKALYSELNIAERDRLRRQYRLMGEYSEVLGERIEAFSAG